MSELENSVTDAQVRAWAQITESMDMQDLIRRKWLLEGMLTKIKTEIHARCARTVDEVLGEDK